MIAQCFSYAFQFLAVITAQGNVIEAHAEGVELVVRCYFAFRALEGNGGGAGKKDKQVGRVQYGLKTELIDIESFGLGHVRNADSDVVYSRCFDADGF